MPRNHDKEAFMLGMAVSALSLNFGECRSRVELASYISAAGEVLREMGRGGSGSTSITREAIRQVEERGLRKCRRGIMPILAKEHLLGQVEHLTEHPPSPSLRRDSSTYGGEKKAA